MKQSRRNIFKFAGGAVAGAFFTPAPWRLITDTALWSESWPGIPRPVRGDVTAKFTNCGLCSAGCAIRARCVNGQPVSLAGLGGGLCPFGLTAHHLPFHPARLTQGPVEEATAAVKARGTAGLAILDLNPGRTASWTYRRAMASLKGSYLATADPVAYDLSSVRTVLSIGTPLLDGWGTPSKVFPARRNFRLIQAEALESRTAVMADQWIPLAPGTERIYAQQVLATLRGRDTSPVAAQLKANGPSVVIGDAPEVAEINRLLGAWGKSVVARAEAPAPDSWRKEAAPVTALDTLPEGSVRTLLIDESAAASYIPWDRIAPKLTADALVVTFAATKGGYVRHATYALPIAIYPEFMDDLGPAADSADPAWRISAPLVPPPAAVANLAEFAGALAGISASNTLRERAGAIHKAGLGTLTNYATGNETALKEVAAEDFWKVLSEGGAWQNVAAKRNPPEISTAPLVPAVVGAAPDLPLLAIREPAQPALVSPLMTKLYQESNLRLAPNRVALHPDEARAANLRDGARAILYTHAGRCAVQVTVDSAVPPGSVYVGSSPGIQDICSPAAHAKVVPA
ncbi:MAG: molybdopterin dinucleotide binding domain-containing protein [Candidatus Solibacter sp.]